MLTNNGLGFRVCLRLVGKKAFSKGALRLFCNAHVFGFFIVFNP